MIIYRVDARNDDGHQGYSWFATLQEANADANAYRFDKGQDDERAKVEVLTIGLGKKALIAFLNLYASHPDNG